MADISHIKIRNKTHDIRDYRVPLLPESENIYYCGDGEWSPPAFNLTDHTTLVDGGNHLIIYISE